MKTKLLILSLLLTTFSAQAQLLSVYQADMMSRVLSSEVVQSFLHTNLQIKRVIGIESVVDEAGRPQISTYRLKYTEKNLTCEMDLDIYRVGSDEDKVILRGKSCY